MDTVARQLLEEWFGETRRDPGLAPERNPEHRGVFDYYLGFAEEHRNVIQQFGRFPHRNAEH